MGLSFFVSEMTLRVNPPDQQDLQKAQPCCEFHKLYIIIKTCHQTYSSLELRTPFWGFPNFTLCTKKRLSLQSIMPQKWRSANSRIESDFKNNAIILKIQKVPREERISKKKNSSKMLLMHDYFYAGLVIQSSFIVIVLYSNL